MRTRLLSSALLMGVLVGAAASCGEESPAAGPGGLAVIEGTDTRAVTGTEVPVIVPNGTYVFTVAEPRTELPDDVDSPAGADSGATYVGIAWRPDGNAPEFGPVLHGTESLPAPVRVVQGDTEVEVTELGPQPEGFNANGVVWVEVADGGPGPELEVEYDGLVQTFDLTSGEREPGPADGFYDDTGTARVECRGAAPGGSDWRLQVGCDVTDVASVPYVAEHGWAEEGRTWLVLGVTLSPRDLTPAGRSTTADYEVLDQQGSIGSGGERAVVLSEDQPLGAGWSAAVAVLVDETGPATLDVRRSYDLAVDSGTVTVGYAASISVPSSTP